MAAPAAAAHAPRGQLADARSRLVPRTAAVKSADWGSVDRCLDRFGYPTPFAPVSFDGVASSDHGSTNGFAVEIAARLERIHPADYSILAAEIADRCGLEPPELPEFSLPTHILDRVTAEGIARLRANIPQDLLDLPIWVVASREVRKKSTRKWTDEDDRKRYVLICCARSRTPILVLDL